jgi:hypothetical protein
VGPFSSHFVVVDGRRVPYLTATPRPGGIVTLTADGRFDLDVPVADLDRIAEWVAFCIAVASGFTGIRARKWPGRFSGTRSTA